MIIETNDKKLVEPNSAVTKVSTAQKRRPVVPSLSLMQKIPSVTINSANSVLLRNSSDERLITTLLFNELGWMILSVINY